MRSAGIALSRPSLTDGGDRSINEECKVSRMRSAMITTFPVGGAPSASSSRPRVRMRSAKYSDPCCGPAPL